jgi:hypothetical protein
VSVYSSYALGNSLSSPPKRDIKEALSLSESGLNEWIYIGWIEEKCNANLIEFY